MKKIFRLLPIVIALAASILVSSCSPQKQYGCPNHLETAASAD